MSIRISVPARQRISGVELPIGVGPFSQPGRQRWDRCPLNVRQGSGPTLRFGNESGIAISVALWCQPRLSGEQRREVQNREVQWRFHRNEGRSRARDRLSAKPAEARQADRKLGGALSSLTICVLLAVIESPFCCIASYVTDVWVKRQEAPGA